MRRFIIEQSDADILSHSGLALVGMVLIGITARRLPARPRAAAAISTARLDSLRTTAAAAGRLTDAPAHRRAINEEKLQ